MRTRRDVSKMSYHKTQSLNSEIDLKTWMVETAKMSPTILENDFLTKLGCSNLKI